MLHLNMLKVSSHFSFKCKQIALLLFRNGAAHSGVPACFHKLMENKLLFLIGNDLSLQNSIKQT